MRSRRQSLMTAAAAPLLGQQVPEAAPLWENPVRRQLAEGKPVIGCTIAIPSAEVAAQAANMGFDFLWIEMEHSAITLETARQMILATRGLKAVPFIRVPVNELWTAKRALDVGALGIIFPFTSTPDLAAQAARAVKYPPTGRRGAGGGLASFRWPGPERYYEFADRNTMCIIIIEEQRAVENIEEIASTPGIDVIFIGTNDLAFSYGKRGDFSTSVVQDAIARIVAAGKKSRVALGRSAGTPDQIAAYVKQGFTFFQGPSDINLMAAGARTLLDPLGKSGIDPKKQPLY